MLKREVLRNKNDFNRIYRRGKSLGDRYVVFFFLKNHLPYSRYAFLASKKVGNSVQRNRAKRLMKESLRLLDAGLPEGYDYIIIARNTINGKGLSDVMQSLRSAIRRSKLTGRGKREEGA